MDLGTSALPQTRQVSRPRYTFPGIRFIFYLTCVAQSHLLRAHCLAFFLFLTLNWLLELEFWLKRPRGTWGHGVFLSISLTKVAFYICFFACFFFRIERRPILPLNQFQVVLRGHLHTRNPVLRQSTKLTQELQKLPPNQNRGAF